MIKLLIVEDHHLVRLGLRGILDDAPGIEIIGEAESGEEALQLCRDLVPDVILMDLNMPGLNGLSATEMILEQRPETRILVLSMHDTPEYISNALGHGAMGYVLKDVPTDEIKRAIDAVMSGERYLCTGAEGALRPVMSGGREQLTNREQTVLLQLAQGKSNKEVAQALDISVRTVETHRKNIKRKLGISSTAGLTRYALEHGVLQGTGVNV